MRYVLYTCYPGKKNRLMEIKDIKDTLDEAKSLSFSSSVPGYPVFFLSLDEFLKIKDGQKLYDALGRR